MNAITSPLVGRMLALLEERSAEAVSLHVLGDALGRHQAYLGRIFKEQTGRTVRQHLAQLRLDRAASAIALGDKIEAVAIEVGYKSKKNFYRQFRRRHGVTPGDYRRSR